MTVRKVNGLEAIVTLSTVARIFAAARKKRERKKEACFYHSCLCCYRFICSPSSVCRGWLVTCSSKADGRTKEERERECRAQAVGQTRDDPIQRFFLFSFSLVLSGNRNKPTPKFAHLRRRHRRPGLISTFLACLFFVVVFFLYPLFFKKKREKQDIMLLFAVVLAFRPA